MKTIFILLFLSIISQSCITPKAKYTDKGTVNNNSAIFSINGAKLSNKKSVIGITTQIISAGVGGYLGYKYFPVALGYTDGKLNASSMGGAVLGGIAGYGINNSFNYLRGEKRQFQLNQNNYNTWKKSFDPNNKFIAINNNYSNLEFVDKGYESKFSIKNFEDAQYFKKAFPNSQYSQKVFEDAVKTLNRTYLPSLSKLYTNVNQESLYKSHLLSASNFNEYKESVELFPFNKESGENSLAKTVRSYNEINSFNNLYPNSKYTGEIAKSLIYYVSLSDLNSFLQTYKKHFSIDAMPDYDKIEQKGYLLEWILAFNNDKKTDPLKTKYLNYSENLADFAKYSSEFQKNYINSEWNRFKNNKNIENGKILYDNLIQLRSTFTETLVSKLSTEIKKLTLDALFQSSSNFSSLQINDMSEQIKNNTWLNSLSASYLKNLENNKLTVQKSEILKLNIALKQAIKDKNYTLSKRYISEGANLKELNFDEFIFVCENDPSSENASILLTKDRSWSQDEDVLNVFPNLYQKLETESFEQLRNNAISEKWCYKCCEIYLKIYTRDASKVKSVESWRDKAFMVDKIASDKKREQDIQQANNDTKDRIKQMEKDSWESQPCLVEIEEKDWRKLLFGDEQKDFDATVSIPIFRNNEKTYREQSGRYYYKHITKGIFDSEKYEWGVDKPGYDSGLNSEYEAMKSMMNKLGCKSWANK